MLGKNYLKTIIYLLMVGFIAGCAPKYAGHFQLKSHKMDRYAIDDMQEEKEEQLLSSVENMTIKDEVVIKEVITDPEQIDAMINESSEQVKVIKPGSNQELIETLKADPEATVAINLDELSKKEKRALKKEVKKQLKEHDEAGVLQYNNEPNKILYYILAIFLPPLAVGLWRGIGKDFWINLLLTLLLYLPGLIHAIITISSKPKTTGTARSY